MFAHPRSGRFTACSGTPLVHRTGENLIFAATKQVIMRRLLLLSLLLPGASYGQGNVKIVKDSRIDGLVRQESAIVPPATCPQITGYRIQLFFDSNKSSVDDARARFVSMFPKVDTYVSFTAPHYFLKVGDFRTQMEAEKVKAQVDQSFPTNFIVKELVNLPRIDQ
jgi:hypothetical protein